MQANFPPTPPPIVVSHGRWRTITPAWIARRERYGLTPRDIDLIALARYAGSLTIAGLIASVAQERAEGHL